MKTMAGLVGCLLALTPALAMAQAKPTEAKPAEKTVAKPAMQHDMSAMKHDTGTMKHEMAGMGKGAEGLHDMPMKSGWNEFDAFHALMMSVSGSTHKDDFKPVREKAAELVTAADAWAASTGPAKCDNPSARRSIPAVVSNTKALAQVVRDKGADAKVKAALELTHTEFEKVAMPCLMPPVKKP